MSSENGFLEYRPIQPQSVPFSSDSSNQTRKWIDHHRWFAARAIGGDTKFLNALFNFNLIINLFLFLFHQCSICFVCAVRVVCCVCISIILFLLSFENERDRRMSIEKKERSKLRRAVSELAQFLWFKRAWLQMDQRRTFPVSTTTTTLLSGNSQYGKRAGVLLQEKKTSRTRRYPATPHTYTVQSFFATSQFDCFSLALLCIFHHSFIKITNVCKWVLDIPTTPLTEANIAGPPLPIASHCGR